MYIKRSAPPKKRRGKVRPGRVRDAAMEALRREVFERDGYRCCHMIFAGIGPNCERMFVRCNKPVTWESGHLAHIKAKRMGGDSPENTQTECPDCHNTYHRYGPSMTKPVPKKEKV